MCNSILCVKPKIQNNRLNASISIKARKTNKFVRLFIKKESKANNNLLYDTIQC